MRTIKSFENFTKVQKWGNGFTQWEKRYDDGSTATVAIDDTYVTRSLVRSAFAALDDGHLHDMAVFTKKDAETCICQNNERYNHEKKSRINR